MFRKKKKLWRAYGTVGTSYIPDWFVLHEGGFLRTYWRGMRFRDKHPFSVVSIIPQQDWEKYESRLDKLGFTLAELPSK